MANASWWQSQGFNLLDQPTCVEVVTSWLNQAKISVEQEPRSLQLSQTQAAAGLRVSHMMPATARKVTERSMRHHLVSKRQQRAQAHSKLFASSTSRHLSRRLLGGADGVELVAGN